MIAADRALTALRSAVLHLASSATRATDLPKQNAQLMMHITFPCTRKDSMDQQVPSGVVGGGCRGGAGTQWDV
jgi:hypothetical protein